MRDFLEIQVLKAIMKGVLPGHTVAMATYCATKMITTCPPMIGQQFDTLNGASTDYIVVIMIHQNLSRLGKCWKLF